MTLLAATPPSWSGFGYEGDWDVVWYYTLAHLRITVLALALGAVLAFPLGIAGYRWRRSYAPILGTSRTCSTRSRRCR